MLKLTVEDVGFMIVIVAANANAILANPRNTPEVKEVARKIVNECTIKYIDNVGTVNVTYPDFEIVK